MSHLIETLYSRILQIILINHRYPRAFLVFDRLLLRAHFPSLFDVTGGSLTRSSPQENGRFFAALYKVSEVLVIFLLQNPSRHDVQEYCNELQEYVSSRSSGIAMQELRMSQLATLLTEMGKLARAILPVYAERERTLIRLDSRLKRQRAVIFSSHLVYRILYSLVDVEEHLDTFRHVWTFRQYLSFARAFRRELSDCPLINDYNNPQVRIVQQPRLGQIEYELDSTETEYQAIGEAISIYEFCEPVDAVPKASACSVCLTEIECGIDGVPVVGTKCKHFFHEECLATWINSSGMKTSNTCPSCRFVLCEPRQRAHPSEWVERLHLRSRTVLTQIEE